MAIGDRVRAAEEAKAEQALNDAGKLSPRQMSALVAQGMSIAEARGLAADGMTYEEIGAIAAAIPAAVQANPMGPEMAKAISDGIANAREPIPENKTAPEISYLNPFGDRDHPRPGLKHDWWYGQIDDKTKKVLNTGYKIDDRDLTVWEQLALNLLPIGPSVIKRLDGAALPVSIVEHANDFGKVQYALLGLPANVISKAGENKNMVPPIPELVRQITGIDLREEVFGQWQERTGQFVFKPGQREALLSLIEAHRERRYEAPAAVAA